MVAVAPVFAMAVWVSDRRQAPAAIGLLAATVTLGLLPFLIWDARALWDSMIAAYPRVMREAVWSTNDGTATNTIGLTGWLLTRQQSSLVVPAQLAAMAGVYVAAWFAIRRRRRPIAWMVCALLVFSMTTLWPVLYIYFDVVLLLASAALAETIGASRFAPRWWATLMTLAALAAVVVSAAYAMTASRLSASPGSAETSRAFQHGFSRPERDGSRQFAWIAGTRGTVILPRHSTADADIIVTARPVPLQNGAVQHVTAVLNGTQLGETTISGDWRPLTFAAPHGAWWNGFNQLDLLLSATAAPRDSGTSGDARPLALAVMRVDVEPHAAR
jgi:hypothetical protein